MAETILGEQTFYRIGRTKTTMYSFETEVYCPETNTLVKMIKIPSDTSFEIENPSEPPSIPENSKKYVFSVEDWVAFKNILTSMKEVKQEYKELSKRATEYLFEDDITPSDQSAFS